MPRAEHEQAGSAVHTRRVDIHAIIRWRYRFGPELSQSVRGVTVMRLRDGLIVEALGYAKSGDPSVAAAVRNTR
jgi:hypothetical protein